MSRVFQKTNKVQFKVKYMLAIKINQQKARRYKCTCTVYLSLSLNSERNGIIILASKQRLLWRIAPELFTAALEKLCFQAQTYVYTAEVPDQFFQKGWKLLYRIFYIRIRITPANYTRNVLNSTRETLLTGSNLHVHCRSTRPSYYRYTCILLLSSFTTGSFRKGADCYIKDFLH